MNTEPTLTQRAQQWACTYLHKGDIAIDATVGNGHDTLFLAQAVGPSGKVYGFDIQQQALDNCYQRLREHQADKQVSLHHGGHETMSLIIPDDCQQHIKVAMFNLGYLPGGDKQRTTQISTSIHALDSALSMLHRQGMITVLAYTGHSGGRAETEAVKAWAAGLNTDAFDIRIESPTQGNRPSPELIIVNKR